MKDALIAQDAAKHEKKEAGPSAVSTGAAAEAEEEDDTIVGPSPAKTRKRPPKA